MKLRSLLPLVSLAVLLLLGAHTPPASAEDPPAASEPVEPPPEQPEVCPPPPAAVLKTFKGAEVRSHVFKLASDKLGGRPSGYPECDEAGAYIEEQITEWGLEPAGENGTFRQSMEVRRVPFPGQDVDEETAGTPGSTFNVIAIVRGTDEALRDEFLVMSAHYDHVGRKSKRKVFNGADDNASGSSALLQVARAFADEDAPRPRRSILFLWCTAEERGLLGSKHFVDNPTVPVAQMVANLNIDMVGRNESKELHVYGNASSPDLDAAHNRATEFSGFTVLAKTGSIFLRSDQVNFYRKDIPCLFFTSGLHSDYHATSDEAKRIDTGKASRAALHAYVTAWEIANRTARPRFTKMDESASAGPLGAILDLVPREGLPDHVEPKDGCGAALVRSVMDGGPAKEAGLQPGDFILEADGRDLPENDPVGAVEEAIGRATKAVTLRVARGKRKLKIKVEVD